MCGTYTRRTTKSSDLTTSLRADMSLHGVDEVHPVVRRGRGVPRARDEKLCCPNFHAFVASARVYGHIVSVYASST